MYDYPPPRKHKSKHSLPRFNATANPTGLTPPARPVWQRGLTAIELMVVVAIVAILAALAAPSFNDTLDRQRLIGAAETVLADVRWARAEAIKRNSEIRVTFTTGSSWSYTIDTNPALAVSDGVLPKTVNGSDFAGTSLSAASFAGGVAYTSFNPARGNNPNNGTVTLTSGSNSAKMRISTLGRARICDAPGGYDAC